MPSPQRFSPKFISTILLLLLFLTIPNLALAAQVSWVRDASGEFSDATAWSGGKVPTAVDDVVIDRPNASIQVTVSSGSYSVRSVTTTDGLKISSGSTFAITASSTFAGPLSILNGSLLQVSGTNVTLNADSTVDITGGRFSVIGGAVVNLHGPIAKSDPSRSLIPTITDH